MVKPVIWGFPWWDGKGVVFNARQESALKKPMFKKSLLERRVAVLTTGFFEWTPVSGQKKKDRYLFTGEEFLYLAGLWNSFHDPLSGQIPEHFTILTTEANLGMSRYHDRMPVILAESEVEDWLAGKDMDKFINRGQSAVKAEKSAD